MKNCRDLLQSTYNKERLDQPLEASIWLKNFKTANERFLSEVTRLLEVWCWTVFRFYLLCTLSTNRLRTNTEDGMTTPFYTSFIHFTHSELTSGDSAHDIEAAIHCSHPGGSRVKAALIVTFPGSQPLIL